MAIFKRKKSKDIKAKEKYAQYFEDMKGPLKRPHPKTLTYAQWLKAGQPEAPLKKRIDRIAEG